MPHCSTSSFFTPPVPPISEAFFLLSFLSRVSEFTHRKRKRIGRQRFGFFFYAAFTPDKVFFFPLSPSPPSCSQGRAPSNPSANPGIEKEEERKARKGGISLGPFPSLPTPSNNSSEEEEGRGEGEPLSVLSQLPSANANGLGGGPRPPRRARTHTQEPPPPPLEQQTNRAVLPPPLLLYTTGGGPLFLLPQSYEEEKPEAKADFQCQILFLPPLHESLKVPSRGIPFPLVRMCRQAQERFARKGAGCGREGPFVFIPGRRAVSRFSFPSLPPFSSYRP